MLPFPTRVDYTAPLAPAILDWAAQQNLTLPAIRTKADAYETAADLAGEQLGPQHPSYRRVCLKLVSEFVADVDEPLTPGGMRHLNRLLAQYGVSAVLRAVAYAMEQGAGIGEQFEHDALSALKYAAAVLRNGNGYGGCRHDRR